MIGPEKHQRKGLTMPTYRANPTDRQQTILETAASEDGIIVDMNAATRVVAKGNQTGAQKVNSAGGGGVPHDGKCAGVVIPWKDQPGRFVENEVGKP